MRLRLICPALAKSLRHCSSAGFAAGAAGAACATTVCLASAAMSNAQARNANIFADAFISLSLLCNSGYQTATLNRLGGTPSKPVSHVQSLGLIDKLMRERTSSKSLEAPAS